MLQRVQTLFLILVVILGVVSSFLPIMGLTSAETEYVMNAYKTISVLDASVLIKNMGVGVMQGIILLVAIATIFMFKKRSVQIKLGKLNLLLISVQIVAIVMYIDVAKTVIDPNTIDVLVSFKLGTIIPVLSLLFTYLAVRFIKKDDVLIRSADRLR